MRLSLQEILGDLENKDLQLMLAMQDLTIATGEIKMATEMRRKLDNLSRWVGVTGVGGVMGEWVGVLGIATGEIDGH